MASENNRVLSLYKSRKTILELLESQGFNVDDNKGFSIEEVSVQYNNSQMDMLISHRLNDTKTYVKYYMSPTQVTKQIKPLNLNDIIEDLFTGSRNLPPILTKADTLIIIIDDEPNDTIISNITYKYDNDGIFVVIHNLARLQFNILNHELVPEIRVLTDAEKDAVFATYNVNSLSQMPELSRFDPQALAICLRPTQVCHIKRKSITAIYANHYCACV